ncbi:hypothetical protein MUK42_36726, partial [Musa troglodytarum]
PRDQLDVAGTAAVDAGRDGAGAALREPDHRAGEDDPFAEGGGGGREGRSVRDADGERAGAATGEAERGGAGGGAGLGASGGVEGGVGADGGVGVTGGARHHKVAGGAELRAAQRGGAQGQRAPAADALLRQQGQGGDRRDGAARGAQLPVEVREGDERPGACRRPWRTPTLSEGIPPVLPPCVHPYLVRVHSNIYLPPLDLRKAGVELVCTGPHRSFSFLLLLSAMSKPTCRSSFHFFSLSFLVTWET